MRECLKSGAADFVGIARPMVLDPAFPSKVLSNTGAKIELPIDSDGSHMSVAWYESKLRGLVRGL
jgi:2,4-dienoyl-CoA reductase-like NADH-dependent reductase (Old Yellow Enzyme family)